MNVYLYYSGFQEEVFRKDIKDTFCRAFRGKEEGAVMTSTGAYDSGERTAGGHNNFLPGGVDMAVERVFVNNDNAAAFVCSKCNKLNTLDIFGHQSVKEAVKVIHRCTCGHTNSFFLERRRFRRRKVSLPGVCAFGKEKVKRLIIVKDLSRGGLKLKLQSRPKAKPRVGDKVFLAFYLDDEQKTLVTKKAVIRNISWPYMGVEFQTKDLADPFDQAIGMYMLH